MVFETLVRPALRRLAGHADDRLDRPRVVARLGEPVRSPAGKVSFLRVRLAVGDEGLVATLTGNQGSGVLSSCVAADGLAVVPAEHRELPDGLAGAGPAAQRGPGVGELSHLDDQGAARMVDVSAKPETERVATAGCRVVLAPETLELLASAGLPKGDALAVARVAGIMGAKRTPDLIPLCHPLPITGVEVDLALEADAVRVTATVRTTGRTGVEMEALTAAATAALTLYDMVKGVQRDVRVEDLRLLAKRGGRSGEYLAT